MKTKSIHYAGAAWTFAALMIAAALSPLAAQTKLQRSPGGYHGELDFPISWKRYYSYAEWTKIMHDMQKQYAHLADIESIGKSRMGRDQYLITLTAKSTGGAEHKTAMWIDGAVHGNEVNGITCSLYLMWYLLTRYEYDAYVFALMNNCTFYILPGLNVDANDSFVRFPNTPNNPRETYRPEDDDGDGLYDEDQTEDIDGDGELSTMYVEDPAGDYKLSADKRQFVEVSDKSEKALRFRRIGAEGFDNDGDGRFNEDDLGGPDPNRNYPAGWNLANGNPYPLSEYCTRNAYEFMLRHQNIFAAFHYHNTGRIIYFSAPEAVRDPNQSAEQRQRVQEQIDRRLEEMRAANKYAQLFNRSVPPQYQEDLDAQTKIVTTGARILKNYRPAFIGGNGQAPASDYDMLGAYGYLIELWGSPAFDADENGDGRVSDEEYLKWIDIELTGEGWVNPHTCTHPDLGGIWIGGTPKKHTRRTPPARYIEMEALKNAHFVLFCASQFPRVEIDDIRVTPATADLYWLDVTVKNDRDYPTASDRALQLERAVRDKLTFSSSDNISIVRLPEGSTVIDPLNEDSRLPLMREGSAEFRLKGRSALTFRLLAKMDGASGWAAFTVTSQFGGVDTKKVTLKVSE